VKVWIKTNLKATTRFNLKSKLASWRWLPTNASARDVIPAWTAHPTIVFKTLMTKCVFLPTKVILIYPTVRMAVCWKL